MFKVFEIMNMDMYRVNRNHPARFSTHSDLGPGRENALSLGGKHDPASTTEKAASCCATYTN